VRFTRLQGDAQRGEQVTTEGPKTLRRNPATNRATVRSTFAPIGSSISPTRGAQKRLSACAPSAFECHRPCSDGPTCCRSGRQCWRPILPTTKRCRTSAKSAAISWSTRPNRSMPNKAARQMGLLTNGSSQNRAAKTKPRVLSADPKGVPLVEGRRPDGSGLPLDEEESGQPANSHGQ